MREPSGRIVDDDDVVEGIVLLRKGAPVDSTLRGIEAKVKWLNSRFLPAGVKIVPYLDRSNLIHYTTDTVLRNLTDGFILVTIILFFFLGTMGQPNINLIVDRSKADRYGINVSDIQDAIETAVGGIAVSEVLRGEERFDLVVRYQQPYRNSIQARSSGILCVNGSPLREGMKAPAILHRLGHVSQAAIG
ncbi:MAG: efflux RND transporter permease subunit [Terriglobia bacterium]